MIKIIPVLLMLFSLSGLSSAVDLDSKKAASRQAVQAYGKALKGELVAAMKAGGPVNAVGVCNVAAPAIEHSVSTDKGVMISRTSLKHRNANNAPSDWQEKVLNDFEARKSAGDDPGKLEFAQVVDTDSGQEYRYMKAISTGDVCLKCHGDALPDDLTAKLSELYPDDKATGYAKGDIRGAFVVVEQLN